MLSQSVTKKKKKKTCSLIIFFFYTKNHLNLLLPIDVKIIESAFVQSNFLNFLKFFHLFVYLCKQFYRARKKKKRRKEIKQMFHLASLLVLAFIHSNFCVEHA